MKKTYGAYTSVKKLFIIALALLTALIALFAIANGSSKLTILQVLASLCGRGTPKTDIIVLNIRLPRILTAIVAGAGLSAAGCVMQSILRNPLASSSTLGISQGAAFGAAAAIILFNAGAQKQSLDGIVFSNPYLISVCAFIGAMLSTVIILGLSKIKKTTPETMILCGVALSSLFAGGTALLQYFADDVKIAAVVFWTFGNLGSTSHKEILIMGGAVCLSLTYFFFNVWNYNALQNGESTAKGLGVDTDVVRLAGMAVCSFTASVIVSYVGIINFIGLIAPHLMRRIVGSDYRFLLPASAFAGAVLLLLSDTFARLAVQPVVLPIGAITSFLGAPLFIALIFKTGKRL